MMDATVASTVASINRLKTNLKDYDQKLPLRGDQEFIQT